MLFLFAVVLLAAASGTNVDHSRYDAPSNARNINTSGDQKLTNK